MKTLRSRRVRLAIGAAVAAVTTATMLAVHGHGQASTSLAPGSAPLSATVAGAIRAAGYRATPALAGQRVTVSQSAARDAVLGGRGPGFTILSGPTLQWVDQVTNQPSPYALHCLCWVVEVKSPRPLYAHGPKASTSAARYSFLQFIDSATGKTMLVVSGGGMG